MKKYFIDEFVSAFTSSKKYFCVIKGDVQNTHGPQLNANSKGELARAAPY